MWLGFDSQFNFVYPSWQNNQSVKLWMLHFCYWILGISIYVIVRLCSHVHTLLYVCVNVILLYKKAVTSIKYRALIPSLSLSISVASCQSSRRSGAEIDSLFLLLIPPGLFTSTLSPLLWQISTTPNQTRLNCRIAPGLLSLLWTYASIEALAKCVIE